MADTELEQWAKSWANVIRMNWGEPGEDLPGTLIEALREALDGQIQPQGK